MDDIWNKRREQLENDLKLAALNLFQHMGSEAFSVPIGGGLIVAAGSRQDVVDLANEWRPIETAPHDAAFISWNGHEVNICRWHNGEFIEARCVDGLKAVGLTHWSRLLKPPMTPYGGD